jgi:general secretion pathway protein G
VLAIFGIVLYALVTPRIGHNHQARTTAAYADIHGGIKAALDAFQVDNGFYPTKLQDLFQQPNGTTKWHGPYFDPPKLPVDPWGNSYFYEYPGKHNTNGYDLFSAGPDGKPGTDDDIVNWTR